MGLRPALCGRAAQPQGDPGPARPARRPARHSLDPGDLAEQAATWETQVNELAAEDTDISAYISALEERRDENQPEPQGDAIAAEIQRYLRRRNQGPSQNQR